MYDVAEAGVLLRGGEGGRDAIDIVEGKDNSDVFTCILMDFEMPVMNGPEATAALRARGYQIPIFGLTVECDDRRHRFFPAAWRESSSFQAISDC